MKKVENRELYLWKSILLLIPIFFLIISFRQSNELKVWDKNSPLTWDDFQGVEIPKDPESKSNTFIGENFRYKRITGDSNSYVFEFQVRSVMVKSKSRVDPAYKTATLLAHEQLHFDISEYFARQLLLAFQKATYTSDFKDEIKNIRHKLSIQRDAMELQYDEQTKHSLNLKMQSKWNVYVDYLISDNPNLEVALNKRP